MSALSSTTLEGDENSEKVFGLRHSLLYIPGVSVTGSLKSWGMWFLFAL